MAVICSDTHIHRRRVLAPLAQEGFEMNIHFRRVALSSLLFAAACAAPPSQPGDPGDPGQASPVPPTEQNATSMGVSVMSADAHGRPRLIRAIVPRATLTGLSPQTAARDHIAALAPLWLKQARPT